MKTEMSTTTQNQEDKTTSQQQTIKINDIKQKDYNHKNRKEIRQQKLDKAIKNNIKEDESFNVESNNKGGIINKRALMSLTPEETFNATIDDIAKQLLKQRQDKDDPANTKRMNGYLCNNDNKAFHLEIIKRSFTKKPVYTTPDDFAPVVADYFKLCFEYNKIPTMAGLSSFAHISYSTFRNWLNEPQNLFYPIATSISDFIHDMTLNATIEGYLNPKVFSLMATNSWEYKATNGSNSTNTTIVVNNNSQTEQEKIDHINALRLTTSSYNVKDD